MLVDLVIRAEEALRTHHGKEVAFYAVDGQIGGVDPHAVQESLSMNAAKTEARISTPVAKLSAI